MKRHFLAFAALTVMTGTAQAQDALPRLSESSLSDLTWVTRWENAQGSGSLHGIWTNVTVIRLSLAPGAGSAPRKPALTFIAGVGFRQRKTEAVQVPIKNLGTLVTYLTEIINSEIPASRIESGKAQIVLKGNAYFDPSDEYLLAEKIETGKVPANLLSGSTLGNDDDVRISVGVKANGNKANISWPLVVNVGDQSRKLNKNDAQSLLFHLVKVVRTLRDAGIPDADMGVNVS